MHSRLFILTVFLIAATTTQAIHQHICAHDKLQIKPEHGQISFTEQGPDRMLATYESIRILFDFSTLTGVDDDLRQYIQYNIVKPAQNYFQQTIQVQRFTKNITINTDTTCGASFIAVPDQYKTQGVAADLVIFVTAKNESYQSYVAYAGSCLLDSTTNRPYVGVLNYNTYRIKTSNNSAQMESDLVVTLHEMTHVLAFSSSLFENYINPSTNQKLTGHVTTQTVNGRSVTVLNLLPLTARIRTYFSCVSINGAYLEQEGGSGSAGSHWERRIFYNEYMTASAIFDLRISEFTLALLEGSGWYQVDYGMAEPMTWGKGKGCSFVNTPCVNSGNFSTVSAEFCPALTKMGCSYTGRAGAVCGTSQATKDNTISSAIDYWGNKTVVNDIFADNCPIMQSYSNLDCENSDLQSGSTLGSKEYYGTGGKCFVGTLYPTGTLSAPYGYCFKPKCVIQSGNYQIQIAVGAATVTCTSESQISVPGLQGKLYCPDPNTFCNKDLNEGYCRRKCAGRGDCVDKKCVCQDGWVGSDCSQRYWVRNCNRCNSSTTNQTSCFGDQCVCDPFDLSCIATYGKPEGSNHMIYTGEYGLVGSSSTSTDTKANDIIIVAVAAVGGFIVLIAVICLFKCCCCDGKKEKPHAKRKSVKGEHAKTDYNKNPDVEAARDARKSRRATNVQAVYTQEKDYDTPHKKRGTVAQNNMDETERYRLANESARDNSHRDSMMRESGRDSMRFPNERELESPTRKSVMKSNDPKNKLAQYNKKPDSDTHGSEGKPIKDKRRGTEALGGEIKGADPKRRGTEAINNLPREAREGRDGLSRFAREDRSADRVMQQSAYAGDEKGKRSHSKGGDKRRGTDALPPLKGLYKDDSKRRGTEAVGVQNFVYSNEKRVEEMRRSEKH